MEAKQGWFRIPPAVIPDLVSACDGWLSQAVSDAARDQTWGEAALGLSFVVPLIREDQDIEESVAELQRVAEDDVEADAVAWVFPELTQPVKDKDRVFPGVFLFIRAA